MKDSINHSNRKSQYSRYYSSFKGIDVSKNESEVAPYRFPNLVNMYRDYYSKNRDMIETVPGYRVLTRFENKKINGIYSFTCGNEYLLIHAGTSLYAVKKEKREQPSEYALVYSLLEDSRSAGKTFGDKFYLLDGSFLYEIGIAEDSFTCVKVSENAYKPVLTCNGKDKMQKNILTDSYFEKYENPELSKNYENGGIIYSLYESSGETYAKVMGANSLLSKIYIPSETVISGHRYKVRMIGNSAFSNNRNLKEIVISKEVKTIEGAGGNAQGAFCNCSLLDNVVMHGVSSIGERAFKGCDRIKDLWLCDEITSESIDEDAFEDIECDLYFCGINASVIEDRFPDATIYSNCRLYEARENDTVSTPFESSEYERAFTKSDSHNYIGDPCDNNGFWEVKMISSSSLAVSGFRNSSDSGK